MGMVGGALFAVRFKVTERKWEEKTNGYFMRNKRLNQEAIFKDWNSKGIYLQNLYLKCKVINLKKKIKNHATFMKKYKKSYYSSVS